jgi:drug/metabolite transporter (DMT)-like permease
MWQWYAVSAMVCFATMQLVFAHLTRRGMSPAAILLVVFGVAAVFYAGHVRLTRTQLPLSTSALLMLVTAAALSFAGNLFSLRAMAAAPNPGYASAISGVHALVVTVCSIFIFGIAVSWPKLCGVVLCVLGVALLVI